jgi:hypothetical protein
MKMMVSQQQQQQQQNQKQKLGLNNCQNVFMFYVFLFHFINHWFLDQHNTKQQQHHNHKPR